ncbi:mRNA capping enzyme, catalytic domain-containing protein [Entophlyctis helioformis]|nr:mRNA capping enzyme, catalytic domain-containing protein [Entophlyctis helioformis]
MLPAIPGERVRDSRLLRALREQVADLVQFNGNPNRFPGAQPVSFAAAHIQELHREDYYVSEKADGVRCIMFAAGPSNHRPFGGETYLIDRKNDYYRLDLALPVPGSSSSGRDSDIRFHSNTLLDGELVLEAKKDKVTGAEHHELFYMFFDAMVMDGKYLCDRPYNKRLAYLRQDIVKPYMELSQRMPQYTSGHPFRMIQKRVQFSYGIDVVFNQMQGYNHKTDGVIFTSVVAPYTLGTCSKMLKWKPSDENTVDFKVLSARSTPDGPEYRIGIMENGDRHSDFGVLTLDDHLAQEWAARPPVGRIVECRYDPDWPGRWRFSRFRDDKTTANHVSTYNSIMQSIADNVDKDTLITAAPSIRSAWKQRESHAPN